MEVQHIEGAAMAHTIRDEDLAPLSPVEKMELADLLYDTAQQQLEAVADPLTPQQRTEIELRVAADDAGQVESSPWSIAYSRLRQSL